MNTDVVKIPIERLEKGIFLIRGQKMMLDRDLAELYRSKRGRECVRRNVERRDTNT
jgi:hypothetical protein